MLWYKKVQVVKQKVAEEQSQVISSLEGLEKQIFRTVHQEVTPGIAQVTFDSLQKYGDSLPFLFHL